MTQPGKSEQTTAGMSSKLYEVLGHLQVIPSLQSDVAALKHHTGV